MQLLPNTTYNIVTNLIGYDTNQTEHLVNVTQETTFQDLVTFFDVCYLTYTDLTLVEGQNSTQLTYAEQYVLGLVPLRAFQGIFVYGKNLQNYTDIDCAHAYNLWRSSTFTTNQNGTPVEFSFLGIDDQVPLIDNFEGYRTYINQFAGVATMKRLLLQNNL